MINKKKSFCETKLKINQQPNILPSSQQEFLFYFQMSFENVFIKKPQQTTHIHTYTHQEILTDDITKSLNQFDRR